MVKFHSHTRLGVAYNRTDILHRNGNFSRNWFSKKKKTSVEIMGVHLYATVRAFLSRRTNAINAKI